MKRTILTLAMLLTFDVCGFQLLGFEPASSSAQEYYTPAPPRPRRAYSTVDTYNYAHGVTDTSDEKSKRSRKAKKKKVTPNKVKKDKSNSVDSSANNSSSSLTTTYSSRTNSTTGSSTTSNTISNTTSGTNTSTNTNANTTDSATTSSTGTSGTTGNAVDPGGVETLIGINKDKTKKSALSFTAPDPSTLILKSSELSSIPSQPQMPVPPTSMGGL